MKILALCGFGMGSSMVLRFTIEKAAAALGVAAEVENTDLASAQAIRADVVKGSLMAAFGMVILTEGVSILIGTIAPINAAVQSSMGLVSDAATPPDAAFTVEYGGIVGISMFFGLLLHLFIARFTPVKTVFLTGHMLWWFPFVIVAGGVEAGVRGTTLVALSAVLSALYWSLMPWLMRRFVWDATGDESFLIGHPTGILSLFSGYVARAVGDKSLDRRFAATAQTFVFPRDFHLRRAGDVADLSGRRMVLAGAGAGR